MIDHDLGVGPMATYDVKRIDCYLTGFWTNLRAAYHLARSRPARSVE